MKLKHTYWGSTEARSRELVIINPAQVRFLRETPEKQTEVWFAADHHVTVIADLDTAQGMFEPELERL